jgi:hypothetical protein
VDDCRWQAISLIEVWRAGQSGLDECDRDVTPNWGLSRIASVPCSLTYSCCQHNIMRPMIQTIRQFIKS